MLHRKEQQKTGGGTVEPLDLVEWEVACLNIMDDTALEGVGVADFGSADPDAPGTSRSAAPVTVPAGRKRKAVEPLPPLPSPTPPPPPPLTAVEIHPPPQDDSTDVLAAEAEDTLDSVVASPSAASLDCSLPRLQSTIVEAEGEEEGEETVTLEFTPAYPLQNPHEPEDSGDINVLSSSREYSIPDTGHVDHSNEAVNAGVEILQQILQRLTALENVERVAPPPPPPPPESVLPDAVRGIRSLLIRQERRRMAENKKIVTAICDLTEQQRLSGIVIAAAISEQTIALRQILTSNAMQGPIPGASTSSSPPHSPGSASNTTQESPRPRGLRRQRGGKRGGK